MEKLQTRALRVEIVKPLDRTWEDLGSILRTQRAVMGQLKQAAVDAIVACSVAGVDATKEAIAPDARAKSPGGLGYQAILRELERIRGGNWSEAQAAALNICAGSVLAPLSQSASQDYNTWRSAQYGKRRKGHGKKGRASYGRMQPIPVHNEYWSLALGDNGKPEMTVKLLTKGKIRIAVAASRGSHWDAVRRIASGEWEHGDCKLQYREREKKWYALLSYRCPAPERPKECDPANTLVVHRGKRNLLTVMSSTGHWQVVATGNKLASLKDRIRARRRSIQGRAFAERGRGSRGHGNGRRYEINDALSDKEARYIKTLCQQLGARVAQLCKQWGCGTVAIEDYGGIDHSDDVWDRRFGTHFPMHELKSSVVWSVQKLGLSVADVCAEYVSSECPQCGHKDTAMHNHRTGVFHCYACGLDRAADWVAPYHMMRRFRGDGGEIEKRFKQIQKEVKTLTKSKQKKSKKKEKLK